MTDRNRSSLATQVKDLVPDKPRGRPVFGLVVHTTGRGICEQAMKHGVDVLEHAVAYYRAAPYSAHYVIGYDGEIVQITADDRRVPHVGVSAEERKLYLSGLWVKERRLAVMPLKLWRGRWGYGKSPQHLFPGPSVNGDYVGVELPPLRDPPIIGRMQGLWYTAKQHVAVARLADDLRKRHGWPTFPTQLPCPRLLGHEDLDAFGRWDKGGGWDPGALRAAPRFDWNLVEGELAA
jgi:hypothetical protein